ncbi:MAG: lipopolysaccharide biosynthesis protein [Hungatella sp.]|jgi:O-antigen/teichoic acid export membrane protein|nr:lipopolysaccharide biosynthesis protein [Hungatella sp.]
METRWARLLMRTGANKEKQDIVWNMVGSFCYAFASMVLSFLVMRLAGEDKGGIFAFGYSTFGQQMFILAYFGIRPFQITDRGGDYRFGDYLRHRYVTCGAAVAAGLGYLMIAGYTAEKSAVVFLLVCYKVADGFADVYESEFQRNGSLHLTGKSNTFRTCLSVGTFLTILVGSGSLTAACFGAVAAQAVGILLFDAVILRHLKGVDYKWSPDRLVPLTKETGLLFVSVFLDFYVFSAAKYAIDANLDDGASGYFNMIFMPTSVINLAAGFVIRPVLTDLTDAWNKKDLKRFSGKLVSICRVIGALSILALVLAAGLGRPVLWILERILGTAYEGRLTVYHLPFVLIVLGGAWYAFLNLHYYALVIMRKQKVIFGIYAVLTGLAAVLAPAMVRRSGISGAAMAYLILMVIMAAGFILWTWAGIRKKRKEWTHGSAVSSNS